MKVEVKNEERKRENKKGRVIMRKGKGKTKKREDYNEERKRENKKEGGL